MVSDVDVASVQAFTRAVHQATRLRDVWELATSYFRARSVQRFCYHHCAPPGAPDAHQRRMAIEGFPKEWMERYVADRLYEVDPIIVCAHRMTEPFRWSDVDRLRRVTDREREYLDRVAQADLGDGLALQVFGPNGRNGYCGLGYGTAVPPLEPMEVREYQWVCQLSHLRYCAIIEPRLAKTPPLTDRETEVLGWVARGKSNSVIADILGVSPHTVDAYLRRIYLKLGVVDRINAAIRGMGVGLVHING